MSLTFTKLFSSITESTVWCEPDTTRICWICLLAMADSRGRVFGSIPGIANRARISVDAARIAMTTFLSPDPDSRTPVAEGRRIETIDGGWRLINHEKYREIRDQESIKEAKRKYINKRREEERKAKGVDQDVDNVDQSRSDVDRCRHNAEAEAEADKERTTSIPPSAPKQKKLTGVDPDFQINETGLKYAKERGVNVATQLQAFLNHHQAKATKLKDWQAGWRVWCDKSVEFGRSPGKVEDNQETKEQRMARLLRAAT